ncbi:MAG: helix-turn-helix domain-containing protein [Rhodoferax sp.]|jgi:hypothetical protein|nr:helix-turn-helix domain-containing protein [Rhodoferax sp.]
MEKAAEKPTKPKRKPITTLPRGRPTLYCDALDELAFKFCLLGATNDDLARSFEVDPGTIDDWLIKHPTFSSAIKKGRAEADAKVASRLFARATGYEHKAVKIASTPDGAEHITEYIERFPPETAACIFWLKNRRPDKWRDKLDTTVTGADGGPVQHSVTVKFV